MFAIKGVNWRTLFSTLFTNGWMFRWYFFKKPYQRAIQLEFKHFPWQARAQVLKYEFV